MEQQNFYVNVKPIQDAAFLIKKELNKVIIGQEPIIELLFAALLSDGHVLLEGLPGIAKTTTAKHLAKQLSANFSRIQFTPDLMPTDVTGTSIFNSKTSEFEFKRGPIFSNIILIDEINRAPAKTQAALMEVMEENQISYDGNEYKMDEPFFVIATQNPVEQEGTYNLPEAQLDRFIFKLEVTYPDLDEEVEILNLFKNQFEVQDNYTPVNKIDNQSILDYKKIIEQVFIKEELVKYIAQIVFNTRNNPNLFIGASPRASISILKASKAIAAINGRDFVTPDDIRNVCFPVLNHRIILSHEREMEGANSKEIIKEIIDQIEVPR